MTKKALHIILFSTLCILLSGCSKNDGIIPPYGREDSLTDYDGTPRLVIRGTVTDEAGEALQDICVLIPEVYLDEPLMMESYNVAYTDANGKYTIIRYRGQETPDEIVVAATDPSGTYMGQEKVAAVTYDSITTYGNNKIPFNGFVNAVFVLTKQVFE